MFDSHPLRKMREVFGLPAVVGVLLLPLGVLGCATGDRARAEAQSLYPLDRARAAIRLAEAGDCRGVDVLIHLLDDDSDAVRMVAARALERLCGETFGYHYYDPPEKRAQAVARWRLARQRGELHPARHRPGGTGAATAAGEVESAP